jgi:AHBA synthesis associated protein
MTEPEYEAMELFEGGLETLRTLRGKGVGLGLASNRDTPVKPLKKLGVYDLFQAIVGQLDVLNVKPAPDMILKAMELLGARPEETLYVCDSKGDLLASEAAGVKAMAMTTGGHSKEVLSALGAYRTGDKLVEVLSLFP